MNIFIAIFFLDKFVNINQI